MQLRPVLFALPIITCLAANLGFCTSFIPSASAATEDVTTVTLPKAEFNGSATFETLNQDTFVPTTQTKLDGSRGSITDELKWDTAYPITDYGYPGGGSLIRVGGRSSGDTQVTTVGVPLSLPQGGGADISIFPSFMWDSLEISPTTSGAGFTPGSASGRVEFGLWSRAKLLDSKSSGNISRVTTSYDHDSQTYSVAAKNDNYAVLFGGTTGQSNGLSGEGSAFIYRGNSGHVMFHILGTQIDAPSPGSLTFQTPGATMNTWRAIPVVESSFHLSDKLDYQTTLFADISHQIYNAPTDSFDNSDTRTEQYGLENALVYNDSTTLAVSARYVRFAGASFGQLHEWPLYIALTQDVNLNQDISLKITANATDEQKTGIYPAGRVSAKFAASDKIYPFAEVNTVAKMPTLVDRYSDYGFYKGNPDLAPERVFAALAGYHFDNDAFQSTCTVKYEFRKNIQVVTPDFTSIYNAGNAYLFSLNEDLTVPVNKWFDARGGGYFTYSRLVDSHLAFPDLPYISGVLGAYFHYQELFGLAANTRLEGQSNTSGGAVHPAYALFDLEAVYHPTKPVSVKFGVDNLTHSAAQAVVGYPLPGRRYFASLSAFM